MVYILMKRKSMNDKRKIIAIFIIVAIVAALAAVATFL